VRATIRLVASMPGHDDYFTEFEKTDRPFMPPAERAAEDAVRAWGLETKRSDPQKVEVKVAELKVEQGRQVRKHETTVKVQPPLARMTEAEYVQELGDVLGGLPPEFHRFVKEYAWEEGHSSGYEEVVSCARGLVDGLESAVKAYTETLKRKK
jgi:hypothetical protein